MDTVAKNDATDAIYKILTGVLSFNDSQKKKAFLEKILQYLKEKNMEQLWINASLKLCKFYLECHD